MGRQPCCEKVGLKRGPWTIEEDHKLMTFIINNGIHCWRMVPKLAGLLRCGKSCRLRWINYLRPDLKRGALSEFEENKIIHLHARLGNRWSKIAAHFPGRTDNEIKNHWNTRIKKRLKFNGIDPVTHKPAEPMVKHEPRVEQTSDCNGEDEKPEIKLFGNPQLDMFAVEKQEKFQIGSEDGTNILQNYEMLWGRLGAESMVYPRATPSNDQSSSYTIEDSPNPSMVESSSVHEESQTWVPSVDSFFQWDGFNPFDDFFAFENRH